MKQIKKETKKTPYEEAQFQADLNEMQKKLIGMSNTEVLLGLATGKMPRKKKK